MPREAFEHILAELKRLDADGFIVVGGGSPIGLAKAAAAMTKLPYIAVVTTYSGSEMAARWYIGVAENRISGDGPEALPATAIYDPELTLDLPAKVSAASGMNAMAHAVETLYGVDTNPVVQTLAEEGIRLLGSSLPRVVDNPRDLEARTDRAIRRLARGEFPRRGRARTRHRATGAAMVQSRTRADPRHRHPLRHRLQCRGRAGRDDAHQARARRSDAARGLYDLNVRIGLPTGLKDLGMQEKDIGKAVDVVMKAKITHPRPVSKEEMTDIITQAYRGEPPKF